MSAKKTWLITGVSRGLGRTLAETVLARGDAVIGTTRDGHCDLSAEDGALTIVPLELADARSIGTAVERAFDVAAKIDVVVNNAGYGLLGAIEHASDKQVERLFAVDVLGPIRMIRCVLPYLRQQGAGHIVNITSVAGRDPRPAAGLYSAVKGAMEALTKALALEVGPLGIRVTAVAPGGFRTDFLTDLSIDRSAAEEGPYSPSVDEAMAKFSQGPAGLLGDPSRGAAAIVAAVDSSKPPRRLLLGTDALDRARRAMAETHSEIDTWEALTRSTDRQETVRP
ncbi:MAG: SDR family NAD(P)-dependent oxidoreductase [Sphingobium sp.]|nr:SDR family NAD(P)-dependent oxidoreductase [Sphingobium sp.]